MRGKTHKVDRIKEPRRQAISVVIVFTIIAFLLTFEKGAKVLSKGLEMIGIQADVMSIQDTATGLLSLGAGITILLTAAAFASVPFVGVGLVVVGVAFLAMGAFRLYRNYSKNKVIKDDGGISLK